MWTYHDRQPTVPRGQAGVLRAAVDTMLEELRLHVPWRTGRLYRSLRWRWLKSEARIISITFTAPYAAFVNRRGRRKGWARVGIRAGIKKANAVLAFSGLKFRLKSLRPFQRGKLRIHVRLVGG